MFDLKPENVSSERQDQVVKQGEDGPRRNSVRRKDPVQSRSKMTASSVLEAAERIILKEGYDRASTNYIAEVAGVSIGSLYQYFPNKASIISSLIEKTVSSIAVGSRQLLRESIDLPLDVVSQRINRYLLEAFRENRVVLYHLPKESPELIELTKHLSVEKYTHATNLALMEQHRQEVKIEDLGHALHVIEVAVLSNIRRYILENPTGMTDEEFIAQMVRLFVAYLTADVKITPAE